jgi:hypothetical protein
LRKIGYRWPRKTARATRPITLSLKPICWATKTASPALERIADQGDQRGLLVAAAQNVGGARIARAVGARISQTEELGDEIIAKGTEPSR